MLNISAPRPLLLFNALATPQAWQGGGALRLVAETRLAMLLTSSVRCFFTACMSVLVKTPVAFLWLCRLCFTMLLLVSKLCLVTQDSRERISKGQVHVQADL
jgi:hypothetical protein